MAGKHPLVNCNYGYWGGNPNKRYISDNTAQKVLTLNYDKLMTLGLPFSLYREAARALSNPVSCSCVKVTAKQSDDPCFTCYGTGFIPGYLKFGTHTYWVASTSAGWNLTDVVLNTTNRPYRLALSDSAVTGSAISPEVTLSITDKILPWEYKIDAFTRDPLNSTYAVDATIDDGLNWFPLSDLNTINPTSSIKFRVSFTRTTIKIKSPMFEIVRIRYGTYTDIAGKITTEPVIRAIPTWMSETEARASYGTNIDSQGMSYWTLPLSFFDQSLPVDSSAARIADDVFTEARYGGGIGTRYAINSFSYSDTFETFTRQAFTLRRVAPGEIYRSVW